MKTIKYFLFISTVLVFTIPVFSQRGDRVEALRIAFITQRLSLTPAESEKFWPVYNSYRNALSDLRRQTAIDTNIEAMSDADAEKTIQVSIERMEKEVVLFKNFARDLKPIIPARKIAILSKVERNFNEELIKRAQMKEELRPGLKRK